MTCYGKSGEGSRIKTQTIPSFASAGTQRPANTFTWSQSGGAKRSILPVLMAIAAAIATWPPAAKAACELYPRFTPTSARTSNEAWEADQFVESVGVNLHIGSGR